VNDNDNRRYQMFVRVQDFGVAHKSDFATGSLAKQHFTSLDGIINELEGHASAKESGFGLERQGTTTRSQARAELREDLVAINRTARAMSDDAPGTDGKFRLPRGNNDQNLIDAARAFLADATPLSSQFIAHELQADFLEDLQADIADLEAAISQQSSGGSNHVAANAAIDDAMNRGLDVVHKLDAIVKNKYASNPGARAVWLSASHSERAPRHKKPTSQPTTSTNQPSST
jgi:hypothetical protein